ncbi:MAG TPA: co-chaperone DjlA [Gammaproteobacteria bacterium]|nr:co-chaperone DjlA [Gammaproteobacteria bacterium]
MNWWGKILGGTFGFMLGGPLGAALGAALGHQFDKGVKNISLEGSPENDQVKAAFFTATFSVMGHVAKADGYVSDAEIAHARTVMRQMNLDQEQKDAAIKLFHAGKRADFPLQDALAQLNTVCSRQTNLLRMFLEIQLQAAMADGVLDVSERRILLQIAETLNFSVAEFEHLLDLVGSRGYTGARAAGGVVSTDSLAQARKVLGVTSATSDTELKKAYRRLMSQHHPDKLVAKGLPEEMIALANEKTQKIRKAYEILRDHRKAK